MSEQQCEIAAEEWLRLSKINEDLRNEWISKQGRYDEALRRWQGMTGEFEKYKNKDANEPFWSKHCWGKPHGSFDAHCAEEAIEKKLHKGEDYKEEGTEFQPCGWFGAIVTYEKAKCTRNPLSIEKENAEWQKAKPVLDSRPPEAVLPDINCCYNAVNLQNTNASDLSQTCSIIVDSISKKGDSIGTSPIIPTVSPQVSSPGSPSAKEKSSKNMTLVWVGVGIAILLGIVLVIIGIVFATRS
jgi:hypothetical protein